MAARDAGYAAGGQFASVERSSARDILPQDCHDSELICEFSSKKVNASDKLSEADTFDLQQYITRCYGSLTTFNILFKNNNRPPRRSYRRHR
ncbi:MAG: hypothetical protein Udaeo2_32480 [Candidatus Udaeobacter sp.]|nr:MAG: hypothetical protein Udaeo2_32480 [Candidatus Udaeobacter sp.]